MGSLTYIVITVSNIKDGDDGNLQKKEYFMFKKNFQQHEEIWFN